MQGDFWDMTRVIGEALDAFDPAQTTREHFPAGLCPEAPRPSPAPPARPREAPGSWTTTEDDQDPLIA